MRRLSRLALSAAVATAMLLPTSAAAFSPDARCGGFMLSQWTVEVDPGAYDEGVYTFWWKFVGPAVGDPPLMYLGPGTFTVSEAAELTNGNAFIYEGLTIHPAQDGYHWAAFYWDMTGQYFGPFTMSEARAELATSAIYLNVTPGTSTELPTEWTLARAGPIASSCANLFGASWVHRTYPSN